MKKTYLLLTFLMMFLLNVSVYSQPQPPVLIYPGPNATGIPLYLTFDWTDVSGATSYCIQVKQGANTVIDRTGLTASQFEVVTASLTYSTSYYWRAGATNGSGTSWSGYSSFTTQDPPPGLPVLESPTNGAVDISLTPTLNWHGVPPNATSYHVQVSTNSSFTPTVVDISGLVNTGYVIPQGALVNGTLYYWRVNATNSGGTSNWTTPWTFTTVPAIPPSPSLVSPANGVSGISTTPTFIWNVTPGAVNYHLQVASDANFQSLAIDEYGITGTQYVTPSGFLSGQQIYYWRVQASNTGGFGPYSSIWNFTTMIAPPAAPILTSPPNNSTGISRNPVLTWNPVPNANSYRVQVSTSPLFTPLIVNAVTGSATQYTVSTTLQYNTQYYWRVQATNAGGTGNWSNVWNFTTLINPPAAPTLISPPNNAPGVSLTPAFMWSTVATATSYVLQISTNTSFSNLIVNIPNIIGTSYELPSGYLVGNTNYYWRVAAVNAGGQGPYSNPYFHFTTLQSFTLNLKVFLEGFYNGSTQVKDTVKIYLANPSTPYAFRDSSKAYLDENGNTTIGFTGAPNGNYYIVVRHRNHLETWSNNFQSFATGSTTNFNFTDAVTKAYGSNMKQVGSVFVLYGGDANKDGFIDGTDYNVFKSQFGLDRYKNADFNGDDFVDGYDALILFANFGKSIARPY
jgi:hypothetical protein